MAYAEIEINRDSLTIMGVHFPDRHSLERAANAIGSNMYEGFEPTPALVELYRDFVAGRIQAAMLPALVKERL